MSSASATQLLTAQPYPFTGGVSVSVAPTTGGRRHRRRHSRRHGGAEPAPVEVKVGGMLTGEEKDEMEGGRRHHRKTHRKSHKGGKRHHRKTKRHHY